MGKYLVDGRMGDNGMSLYAEGNAPEYGKFGDGEERVSPSPVVGDCRLKSLGSCEAWAPVNKWKNQLAINCTRYFIHCYRRKSREYILRFSSKR